MSGVSYRDLDAWREGMNLAEQCYTLAKQFPKEELFGLTSQVRRAAVSVPANIAEGYGRENRGDYIHHLRIAQESLKELETHILIAVRVRLLTDDGAAVAMAQCDRVGRILRALIRSLQKPARPVRS
jgi:four helix bundle protein